MVAITFVFALGLGLGLGLRHHHRPSPALPTASPNPDDGTSPDSNSTSHGAAWVPKAGQSWQILLKRPLALQKDNDKEAIAPDVDVYDIDLFDNDADTLAALRRRGKRSICYFSAGSYEPWRPDARDFQDADLGLGMEGWPDEKWLNVSSPSVRGIMAKRIELAAQKRCDAVDPDNVDGYQNKNGVGLKQQDSVDFVHFLSDEAKKHGIAIGLKNAVDIVDDVMPFVDFAVNEQCSEYNECGKLAVFTQHDKPVFQIEYPNRRSGGLVADSDRKTCCASSQNGDNFSTIIKDLSLDGWVQYCNGQTYETST